MIHELLLLRHGKSDRNVDIDDYHRPLKDRGKRGAQHIGVWLQQQALLPDLVLSSPAERALVTAEKCCKAMGLSSKSIQRDERIYLAPHETLLQVLADSPAHVKRILLVGHNPGLELLLFYLSAGAIDTPADGKLLATATLARLRMTLDRGQYQKGTADLMQLVRASDLPKKFPYPSAHGTELRDRPAYYYTQSSVIPYRVNNNRLEILIIRSSQDKHWVIPKGIADPGHTLQASAAKEAWEEAGVEGHVSAVAIGSYSYPKWGATCTVTVYPMMVTRQLNEEEWRERHRGRQWVPVNRAIAQLKQVKLGPMLLALEKQLISG